MIQVNLLVTNYQVCRLQTYHWINMTILAFFPHMYQVGIPHRSKCLPIILLSQRNFSVSQLFPSIFLSIGTSQAPSNQSSGLTYTVPSVEHYVGPEYIPTYVTNYISYRSPSIVPDTSPSHTNRSVHSLVISSSTTTDSSQAPINHN